MTNLDKVRKRDEWCFGVCGSPYDKISRPNSDDLPNGFCTAHRSDIDVYLDRHDLIEEIERLERLNDESWLDGSKEGVKTGKLAVIKHIRERSGRMFVERKDDEAKFLRSLADEMEKL